MRGQRFEVLKIINKEQEEYSIDLLKVYFNIFAIESKEKSSPQNKGTESTAAC